MKYDDIPYYYCFDFYPIVLHTVCMIGYRHHNVVCPLRCPLSLNDTSYRGDLLYVIYDAQENIGYLLEHVCYDIVVKLADS